MIIDKGLPTSHWNCKTGVDDQSQDGHSSRGHRLCQGFGSCADEAKQHGHGQGRDDGEKIEGEEGRRRSPQMCEEIQGQVEEDGLQEFVR